MRLLLSLSSLRDVCQVTDPTDIPDSTEQNVSEYNPNNDLIAID